MARQPRGVTAGRDRHNTELIMESQASLFDVPTAALPPGMVGHDSPETSRQAAARVAERLTELQARVLDAFHVHGPMDDEQLEQLPEFIGFGPSTIRKRRSELFKAGRLLKLEATPGQEHVNSRGATMAVWRAA